VTDHQETGAAAGDPRQASVEGRLSTPTRSLDFASVKVGFGARRPVPLTKPECLLSVQLRDLRRAHRKGRDAPLAALPPTWVERVKPTHLRPSCPASGWSCRQISGHSRQNFWSCWRTGSRQFVEQRFGFFEIGRAKAFGEPAVDRCEEIAGFGAASMFAPHPGEACCSAQFV
jgi:hypothetical protein